MKTNKISFLLSSILIVLILTSSSVFAWETTKTTSGKDIKWGSDVVDYSINPNKGPSGAVPAVQGGMNTWSDVPTANFSFSGMQGSPLCNGSYSAGNEICFGPINQQGVVAQNSFWYNPSTGAMLRSEIVFNTTYNWSIGGSLSSFDVQDIITHELGHTLSLKDEYSTTQSENTMYGYASYNEIKKRTLEADDIAGINYLYPSGTSTPSPTPAQCSYTVSISNTKFAASGGIGTATVSTQNGCAWSASSSASWVTMSTPSESALTFTVAQNSTTAIRMATIKVANQSYIITESAAAKLSITASPSALAFGSISKISTLSKNSVIAISGAPISSIQFYISGNNTANFPSTYSCQSTSSSSVTCTLKTTFKPMTVGTKSASIDVNVNSGVSKMSIPLTGTGK